jgi:ribosomal protein L3 glutamine methyltransferase
MTVTQTSPLPFLTLRDCLRYGVSRFNHAQLCFGHGSPDALDEAAYLLLHTLHLPLDKLDPFLDARLLPSEIERCVNVIDRRVNERIPAAYLTSEAWLANYRFYVDPRVIVPRSFLAELIPTFFQPWVDPDQVENILELCTGSACLAIMLADAFPQAMVDASDLSSDALAVAERNVRDYELNHRITLIESDVFANIPAGKKYDIILSNPPYVNSQSMENLPEEFLQEPSMALAGGMDGMDVVRQIIAGAAEHLEPDGVLIVEIGHERDFAEAAFSELELTWLTTSAGDDMVFLITAEQLQAWARSFPEQAATHPSNLIT